MNHRFTCLMTLLFTFISLPSYAIDVCHAEAREGSVLDQYSIELLKYLIESSGETANLIPYKPSGAQARKELQLKEGKYDIDWLGATAEIEERVPRSPF
ncbi:hypothetical protein [Hahella ganghwensis]|uniref:hypothetical protein n=1 Tax=Hahella ganghwensis TaxID=286420 RepID=UPI000372741F|nr:hypothetical protein [Hahella ganghwensis]